MLGSGADYDSDEDDEDGAPRGGLANQNGDGGAAGAAATAATTAGGRPVDEDGDEVLELGTAAGGESGGGRKIKMADALELFHRILDIRKDQQRGAGAAAGAVAAASTQADSDAAASSSSIGGGDDDDASSCPPARGADGSGSDADGGNGGAKRTGDGFDQVAPSAGGLGGEDESGIAGAGWLDDKREEEGDGDGDGDEDGDGGGEGALALRPIHGAGGPDDEVRGVTGCDAKASVLCVVSPFVWQSVARGDRLPER